jgi:sigma-B regulation protein RsbU (phosphoserine phosphatase)
VNAHLFRSTLPEQYATLFFGQYDDSTRRLDYINCGQWPVMQVGQASWPVLSMSSHRSIERLETTALPLGLVRDWAGDRKTVELRRGDTLWVCSDGAVETGLETADESGEEQLISAMAANQDHEIELSLARVTRAVSTYASSVRNRRLRNTRSLASKLKSRRRGARTPADAETSRDVSLSSAISLRLDGPRE